MLHLVQIYRSFAVLAVAFFHAGLITRDRYGVSPIDDVWGVGFSGVHLFFVISGFIIYTAHHADISRKDQFLPYLAKRFIRIYPFYWIVFMIWGGWRIVSGQLPILDFFTNALFFHSKVKHVVPVTWTLAHELVFYGVFSILILMPRIGVVVFLLWMSAAITLHDKPAAVLINPINVEFALGTFSAFACVRLKERSTRLRNGLGIALTLAGLIGFLLTHQFVRSDMSIFDRWWSHPITVWGYGLSSACLMMGSLSPWLESISKKQGFLLLIGNASYAIYLVHLQLEKSASDLLKHFQVLWNPNHLNATSANLIFLIIAALAALVGVLAHLVIEKPLIFRVLRPLILPKKSGRSEQSGVTA